MIVEDCLGPFPPFSSLYAKLSKPAAGCIELTDMRVEARKSQQESTTTSFRN